MHNHKFAFLAAAVAAAAYLPPVQAVEVGGVEFTGSGFMTLAVGRVLGGTKDNPEVNPNYLGYKGPHFISDWAQGGVYEDDGLQYKPDTRLGLQGTATFTPRLSVTGQVVARGARDGKVNLEWLYGTYKLSDQWTLQVGRKRLPIFSLSESQDIGFAYPWVHLPPDTYGWQVVNYNGANLMYSGQLGGWSYTTNLFAGNETNKDTGYQKMYWGKNSKTNVRWTNIVGGEATASNDWFEARVGYFQNDAENGIPDSSDYNDKYKQKVYTLGLSADYKDFIARTEFYWGDLTSIGERDYAQSYALGYRIGKFTPMFTYSRFYLKYSPDSGLFREDEERHDIRSWTLRYDLTTSSALKVQYDMYHDRSGDNFRYGGSVAAGNVRLITASYDMVF